MSKLIVTPLSLIEETILRERPSHMLSLLGPDYMIDAHGAFETAKHLRISVHDISNALPGHTEPTRQHATEVLAFADTWDGTRPMLIHCWAGISRSTASMFMILCKLNPQLRELDILRQMREQAPHVKPNGLLTAHADQLLGREGRMVDALDLVGPPDLVEMGRYFEIPAKLPPQAD